MNSAKFKHLSLLLRISARSINTMLLLKTNGKFGTQILPQKVEDSDSLIMELFVNKNTTGTYLKLTELLLKLVLLSSLTPLTPLRSPARSLVLTMKLVNGNLWLTIQSF